MYNQSFFQRLILIEEFINKIENDVNNIKINAENFKLARDKSVYQFQELDCKKAIKAQEQRLVILGKIKDGIIISQEELAHLKKIPYLANIDSQLSELKVQQNILKERMVEVGYGAMVVGFVALSSIAIASALSLAMYAGIAMSVLAVAYCLWACCYLTSGSQNSAPVASNNFAYTDNSKNESTVQVINQLAKEASPAGLTPLVDSSKSDSVSHFPKSLARPFFFYKETEDLSTSTPVVRVIDGFPQVESLESEQSSSGTPVVRIIGGFPSLP